MALPRLFISQRGLSHVRCKAEDISFADDRASCLRGQGCSHTVSYQFLVRDTTTMARDRRILTRLQERVGNCGLAARSADCMFARCSPHLQSSPFRSTKPLGLCLKSHISKCIGNITSKNLTLRKLSSNYESCVCVESPNAPQLRIPILHVSRCNLWEILG
jgi:hypothetical protein